MRRSMFALVFTLFVAAVASGCYHRPSYGRTVYVQPGYAQPTTVVVQPGYRQPYRGGTVYAQPRRDTVYVAPPPQRRDTVYVQPPRGGGRGSVVVTPPRGRGPR